MLLLKRDIVCLNTISVFSCKSCLFPSIKNNYLFENEIGNIVYSHYNFVALEKWMLTESHKNVLDNALYLMVNSSKLRDNSLCDINVFFDWKGSK